MIFYLKKQLYSKLQFKCVNCGKVGGTIFNESNQKLRAVCGNSTDPRDLNISIEKKQVDLVPKLVETSLTNINNKKREMIKMKLDFLFNYISEDKAIELFNESNSKINDYQEIYYKYLEKYKEIANKNELNEQLEQQQKIINDIKEFNLLYDSTKEDNYIHVNPINKVIPKQFLMRLNKR